MIQHVNKGLRIQEKGKEPYDFLTQDATSRSSAEGSEARGHGMLMESGRVRVVVIFGGLNLIL